MASLLAAAASVFAERGHDAATITEIAERAGASIGSLCQFFPTKTLLAEALHDGQLDALSTVIDALVAATPPGSALPDVAGLLFDPMVAFMAEHPAFIDLAERRDIDPVREAVTRGGHLDQAMTVWREARVCWRFRQRLQPQISFSTGVISEAARRWIVEATPAMGWIAQDHRRFPPTCRVPMPEPDDSAEPTRERPMGMNQAEHLQGASETTLTMTKMAPPAWLMAMWKEIDDKTFGRGFDCFAEDAVCNLGVADWHGREAIRENLRAFIDKGFTAHHAVVEYWDSPLLKVFHGKVAMSFDDPGMKAVRPSMAHFFYMDPADPAKVIRWIGSVGPTAF